MSLQKSFGLLLSIIIAVILIVVILTVFAKPAPDIADKQKEIFEMDSLSYMTDFGYTSTLNINEADSQLEKMGKVFRNFDPDMIHYNRDHIYSDYDINRRLYGLITIEGSETITHDDLSTTITDAFKDWAEENEEYTLMCPGDLEVVQNPLLYATTTCWSDEIGHHGTDGYVNIDDLNYYNYEGPEADDKPFVQNTCKIHFNNPGSSYSDLLGIKRIHIYWYSIINDEDVYEIYPIITVCGGGY